MCVVRASSSTCWTVRRANLGPLGELALLQSACRAQQLEPQPRVGASGLIVVGIGTMRVMWAVPSGSKVAESFCAAGLDWASRVIEKASREKRLNNTVFIETVVPEEKEE